jgi:hypothetical protein
MTARIPPRVPARVPARVVESLISDLVQTNSTSLHAAFLCVVSQPLFCTALLRLSSLSLSFVVVLSLFDLPLSSLCLVPLVLVFVHCCANLAFASLLYPSHLDFSFVFVIELIPSELCSLCI